MLIEAGAQRSWQKVTIIFPKFTLLRTLPQNWYESNGRFEAVEISGDVTEHKKSGILKTSLNINGVDVFRYILCTVLVGI